jgi:hypothetical protein
MKRQDYSDVEWEHWYVALTDYEQEWFEDCRTKRNEARQQVVEATAELDRLRRRGQARYKRANGWRTA